MAGLDLAALARPLTRSEAVRLGHLVDTSACAAFLGFRHPAAVSAAAWEELVGPATSTRLERDAQVERLQALWVAAQQAVNRLRQAGTSGQTPRVEFLHRSANGHRTLAAVLSLTRDGPGWAVTIHLKGETSA